MQSASAGNDSQAPSPGSPAGARWLFGPGIDLFFGCGFGYALVLCCVLAAGPGIQTWLSGGLLAIVVLFANTPHYGATLLRVYDQRETRERYAIFSTWITAGLLLIFVVACYWHVVGSWLVTVYLNWSPWHYAGQNYGIALMFLHRRGIAVSPRAKQWLYASFVLAFGLTFVQINGVQGDAAYGVEASATAPDDFANAYPFIPLAIPGGIRYVLLTAGFAAYLFVTAGAIRMLGRGVRAKELLPTVSLIATHSLWFVVPTMFQTWNLFGQAVPFSPAHTQYAFIFVAASHSLQYLWITTYFARKEPTYRGQTRYWTQCLLLGCLVWTLPALVFAPGVLGNVGYHEGLVMLVAALANVHHFILDGAVWKLRDGAVAKILLRDSGASTGPILAASHGRWIRHAVYATSAVCFAVAFLGRWEAEIGLRRAPASGDVERTRTAVERLAAIGRDDASNHLRLGMIAARNDRPELAMRQFEESLAMRPNATTWLEIGMLHAELEEWKESLHAFETAYDLDASRKAIARRYGWSLVQNDQPERAIEVARAGLKTHPEDRDFIALLRHAQQRARGEESH